MVIVRSHIAHVQDLNGNAIDRHALESSFPSIEAYEAQRTALLQAEKGQRFDAQKLATLTGAERRANDVVQAMKEEEDRQIYNNPLDTGAMKGMDWVGAKARGAHKGSLYRLVEQMPKGAALHCHLDGTVDANWVIQRALQEPNMHILSSAPLSTPASLYTSQVSFQILSITPNVDSDMGFNRADPTQESSNIFSEAYQPETWVLLKHVRPLFPHGNVYGEAGTSISSKSNGTKPEDDFDTYLRSLITMREVRPDFAPLLRTSKQAWGKFLSTFKVIGGLCQNEPILKEYYVKGLESYLNDNVSHVEVRLNFFLEKFIDSHGLPTISHADMLRTFQAALREVQAGLPPDRHFDAKVIYCSVRIIDNERIRWYIEDAIALKQQFPDLVVGFDMVGHEDPGVTLRTYAPELLRMKQRLAQLSIDLPFVFHAGETTSDGDAVDENILDAILLGTRRIGHGFSLIQHPHLIDLVKARGICIESCPISNQLLRFASSTSVHPVLPLLARAVPVAISNDDPTQFQNPGLTPDFYQILSASDHMTLSSLGVLARTSLQHSLLQPNDKKAALQQWDQEWATFVEQVATGPLPAP